MKGAELPRWQQHFKQKDPSLITTPSLACLWMWCFIGTTIVFHIEILVTSSCCWPSVKCGWLGAKSHMDPLVSCLVNFSGWNQWGQDETKQNLMSGVNCPCFKATRCEEWQISGISGRRMAYHRWDLELPASWCPWCWSWDRLNKGWRATGSLISNILYSCRLYYPSKFWTKQIHTTLRV